MFAVELIKRIIVVGAVAGLGALAIFIASQMENIIATRDKGILLIMPGLPVFFALVVLSLLDWKRYFSPSKLLFLLLCLFTLGIAIFDSMSPRGFYDLITIVNPGFSAGSGGYALELKVMRTLANTMGTLYFLAIATLALFLGDGVFRAWTNSGGNEGTSTNINQRPVSATEAKREPSAVPWHYWLISVLALCWFGLGLASFAANLFLGTFWRETTESGLALPPFPMWVLVPMTIANIAGLLGALFMLFKNRNAAGCFLVCLLAALLLLGHQIQFMRTHDLFSTQVLVIGVFTGIVVPTILLWYTLKLIPRSPPVAVSSLDTDT